MELPSTPLLQREAGQSCRSGVHAEEQKQGTSRQLYPELPSGARQGLADPTLGIQVPTGQGASSPGSVNEADRQHWQSTSKPLRHLSCWACCRIPVSLQLFLSTFKLTLCRCTRFSLCHTTCVPLVLSRCLDTRFHVPRTEQGTSSWPGKSPLYQQPGKQEGFWMMCTAQFQTLCQWLLRY